MERNRPKGSGTDTLRWDNRTQDLRKANSKVFVLLYTRIYRKCRDKVPCERRRLCLFRKDAECTVPDIIKGQTTLFVSTFHWYYIRHSNLRIIYLECFGVNSDVLCWIAAWFSAQQLVAFSIFFEFHWIGIASVFRNGSVHGKRLNVDRCRRIAYDHNIRIRQLVRNFFQKIILKI